MNLTITKCSNGWMITKLNYNVLVASGTTYSSGTLGTPSPNYNYQEQFVFATMDDMLEWIKTNFVLERLTK